MEFPFKCLVVTGSRLASQTDAAHIERILKWVIDTHDIDMVVHGDAFGVDAIVAKWCKRHRIPVAAVPAKWSDGPKAGPERNRKMLDTFKPRLVLAMRKKGAADRGTSNCVDEARQRGILIIEDYWL